MRSIILAVGLVLLVAAANAGAAVPPAAHAPVPASASTAAKIAQLPLADRERVRAIEQYRRDLVSVIALRADPDYLIGAAFLARSFKTATPGLDYDSLTARVAAAHNAKPVAHWVRLSVCAPGSDAHPCPNAKALAWLEKHAAANAAVWVIAMDAATDDAAARAALAKAAAAQFYDDYSGEVLADVVKATMVLPPQPDTTAGAHHGQPASAAGVRALVALGAVDRYPRPEFFAVDRLCGRAAESNAKDKVACLKLAHHLQWGSSTVARAMGLSIEARLDGHLASKSHSAEADLKWQVHQYARLLARMLVDPASASAWLARARNGGTELSLMLATLRASDVPIDAPADATPPSATD